MADLLDLRHGDLREPPVDGARPARDRSRFARCSTCRTRRRSCRALAAARLAARAGRALVFDVFAPSAEDIEETDGIWLEREPGIFERADWNERARTLILSVRGASRARASTLHWLSAPEWNALIEDAGLVAEELYGWFDRRPYEGGEDQIWVCRPQR